MPTRAHASWGFAISLLLHATGLAALSLALPRLEVRPGVVRRMELALQPALQPPQPSAAAAHVEIEAVNMVAAAPAQLSAAEREAPAPAAKPIKPAVAKARKPEAAPTPIKLQSAARPDPRADGSALERVLRQIAATTELTQDERRRAMLLVLRTWEDPSGQRSAEELVDALIKNAREHRPR
jgi:ATP-dependent exoDNAse (exonuclease V) beta subunit